MRHNRERLNEISESVKKHMKESSSLEEYIKNKTISFMFRIENLEDLKDRIIKLEKEIDREKEKTAKKSSLLGLRENRVFKYFAQFFESFTCFLMSVSCLVTIYKLIKK